MHAVKIRKYLIGVVVFSFCLCYAKISSAETDRFGDGFNTAFTLGSGYRSDNLDWNIAGDISGNNPNVLSELNWEDLGIFQVKLDNVTIFRGIYFRGAVAYGWIITGDVQDSDYLGDNRTLEFSRSNNNADDGNTFDATVGIGYQFSFGSNFLSLAPMVGYSRHEQNLTLTGGNQTIPPAGPFAGLNSTYEAEWTGPWVGADLVFQMPYEKKYFEKFSFRVSFEYHWADYNAEADWNLRTDFTHPKSFEHDADGSGWIVSADWNIFFTSQLGFKMSVNYQSWDTDPGNDRTFFSDGTAAETRLNDVNWDSFAIMLGIVYRL
ncbi:MAG TPA: TonB-dependent receptor [Deltaproteobacteria bacterium]|nr:TonB-dependent receptor [Deltaproteobacteria bacterium]